MSYPSNNLSVSVLMPVFNGERYIHAALQSLLNQTYKDFELLIIDDGSTDGTVDIIRAYEDRRIRLVLNQSNLGLSETLNKGLQLARGDLVARMDCDDFSLPRRLQVQAAFMSNNLDVAVCGTWYLEVGGAHNIVTRCAPDHDTINCGSLFNPMVGHPSVMLRRHLFLENNLWYDSNFNCAEDYELWVKALNLFKFANIPEILLLYRVHPKQTTQASFEKQMDSAGKVRLSLLKRLGIDPTPEEFEIHQVLSTLTRPFLCNFNSLPVDTQLKKIDKWLCKMETANRVNRIYPNSVFSRILVERWIGVVVARFILNENWSRSLIHFPAIFKQSDHCLKYASGFVLRRFVDYVMDLRLRSKHLV